MEVKTKKPGRGGREARRRERREREKGKRGRRMNPLYRPEHGGPGRLSAVGALRSGNLVDEAMLHQIRASDTWAEYRASRSKDNLYAVMLNGIADADPVNRSVIDELQRPAAKPAAETRVAYAAKTPSQRAAEYRDKIFEEMSKEDDRRTEAKRLEEDSAAEIRKHHNFEYSVALIQVAIAVGAVSALTRVKPVWYLSLLAGGVGIVLFVMGFT